MNRIRELRRQKSVTQETLANAVGATKGQISKLENGRLQLTQKWMERLSHALNVAPSDLLPASENTLTTSSANTSASSTLAISSILVPCFKSGVSAGFGLWIEGKVDPDFFETFHPEWLTHITKSDPKNLVIIFVAGDSMEPTLRDGDQVLIDMTERGPREGIYVLSIDGESYVKRLRFSLDTIHVISDNPIYKDFDCDINNTNAVVHGRVLWTGHKVG